MRNLRKTAKLIPNPSVGRRRYFKRLQEKLKLTEDEKNLLFERKKPKSYRDFLKRRGLLELFHKQKESIGCPQIKGELPPEYDIIDIYEDRT